MNIGRLLESAFAAPVARNLTVITYKDIDTAVQKYIPYLSGTITEVVSGKFLLEVTNGKMIKYSPGTFEIVDNDTKIIIPKTTVGTEVGPVTPDVPIEVFTGVFATFPVELSEEMFLSIEVLTQWQILQESK